VKHVMAVSKDSCRYAMIRVDGECERSIYHMDMHSLADIMWSSSHIPSRFI